MASETTINVNLTPDLYRYVKSVEKSKRYTSVSEFFREALREKKERDLVRRELELKIEAGLKSAREGRVEDGDAAIDELIGELSVRRTTRAKR
ncbi:MAG: type II toxin-antitoxin system ParD family antitoxin [Bryobacterales bacterium]|nr:type II toxin-antitoxin system ParD family antitoxin [Bryobacterales bacterium]